MQNRHSIVRVFLVVMGLLGLGVLLLPWYELTSHTYISGYGSSDGYAGTQSGFVAASTTYIGYALYALPAAAIGLGLGLVWSDGPTRAKALLLEFIGLGEIICMLLTHSQMGEFSTDFSGSGFSSSAGFYPVTGWYVALGVYVVTGLVGFIMMFIAPKEPAPANSPESTAP